MYRTVTVTAQLADNIVEAAPELSGGVSVGAEIENRIRTTNYDEYTGETTVTPSAVPQVLQTRERVVLDNITIAPVPSDWGHIAWNGAVLTVS